MSSKGYLQIDLNIRDLEGFMQYAQKVPTLIEKHGGRYLVQGVEPQMIETNGPVPQRSVIVEFPSVKAARAFLSERQASELHELWGDSTASRILLLEGVGDP